MMMMKNNMMMKMNTLYEDRTLAIIATVLPLPSGPCPVVSLRTKNEQGEITHTGITMSPELFVRIGGDVERWMEEIDAQVQTLRSRVAVEGEGPGELPVV
jgi:hypothetical protein